MNLFTQQYRRTISPSHPRLPRVCVSPGNSSEMVENSNAGVVRSIFILCLFRTINGAAGTEQVIRPSAGI